MRPCKGDTVRSIDAPALVGQVLVTFYENGEHGMHVAWTTGNDHWSGWAHCDRVCIVKKATTGASPTTS